MNPVTSSRGNAFLEQNMVKRFTNLAKGAAIGTTTGIVLRILGLGFWDAGYTSSSLFTGMFVHGPRKRAVQLTVPLTAIGVMARITMKVFLSTISTFPSHWIERATGIGGYLPVLFLQGKILYSSGLDKLPNFGCAVASTAGFANIVKVGLAAPGSLEALCLSIIFSIAYDALGYYLWDSSRRVCG